MVSCGRNDRCAFSLSLSLYVCMQNSVPFTAMLSPRCASFRISSQLVMVNEVPPPPLAEVSRGSRDETAEIC